MYIESYSKHLQMQTLLTPLVPRSPPVSPSPPGTADAARVSVRVAGVCKRGDYHVHGGSGVGGSGERGWLWCIGG